MFKELRRPNQRLAPQGIESVLREAEFGILSVIGEDGYPYGVPMNFAYTDGVVYLHTGKGGHKIESLQRCPKVCFTVTADVCVMPKEVNTYYKSVIILGTAEILRLEDTAEREAAFHAITFKHCPQNEETVEYIKKHSPNAEVIKITVENIEGKYQNQE